MARLGWFFFILILLVPVFCGLASKWQKTPVEYSACTHLSTKPHPFLCGDKIHLSAAKAADFSSVDKISNKLAFDLVEFISTAPKKTMMHDLLKVRGIGEKTLLKLTDFFYD